MFFKTTTEEKVNSLLKESAARESKIKESIQFIDKQIGDLQNKILDLMNKYVSLEIEGNTAGLKEIDKSINTTRQQIESLKGKKEAYSRLSNEDRFIKKAIPKIIESARNDRKERAKLLNKKIQDRNTLEKQIEQMEQKLKITENEIEDLHKAKEVQQVKKVLQYIEPRKIRYSHEECYIGALLDESGAEYLEQHIEPEFRKFDPDILLHNSMSINQSVAIKTEDIKKEPENLILDEIKYR